MSIDRAPLIEKLKAMSFVFVSHLCERVPLTIEQVGLCRDERDEIVAALGAEAEPRGWQPMDRAPKGSWLTGPDRIDHPDYVKPPRIWVLLRDEQRCVAYADAYYAEGGGGHDGGNYWVEEFSGERVQPTHWMPLPPLPSPPVSGREAQENKK